jgi:hypothetical protein
LHLENKVPRLRVFLNPIAELIAPNQSTRRPPTRSHSTTSTRSGALSFRFAAGTPIRAVATHAQKPARRAEHPTYFSTVAVSATGSFQ